MKLLVVEDDPPLQAALLRLVAQWGYATEHASTAAEALGLPDRDGQSLCRQFRRLILCSSGAGWPCRGVVLRSSCWPPSPALSTGGSPASAWRINAPSCASWRVVRPRSCR
ncbi:MAG: hypothetical protein ACKO45_00130 [Cyanobium sp.]